MAILLWYNAAMDGKIIDTFQQRRSLIRALDELAETRSEADLIFAAREIVHTYPADLVLEELLRRLDTPSGQVRGGLGHIAALLPAEETIPRLQSKMTGRGNTPQVRITAALLLERFLGVEIPAGAMGDLADSNEVALQSLREAVEMARRNRHVLLEYVTQLREADSTVAQMVMDLMERLPPAHRVDLLRLMAQDERVSVAREALSRLEALARSEADAAAVRALFTLQFVLSGVLAEQVEQALRRLRFRGIVYEPPPIAGWRALIGPADAAGSVTVWLLRMPENEGTDGRLYGFLLNRAAGILAMFGSEDLPRERLPSPQALGRLVSIELVHDQSMIMLEVPFAYGRWLLFEALRPYQEGRTEHWIPGEYQLYNDQFGQFPLPQIPDLLASYANGELPANDFAHKPRSPGRLASALFRHPVMAGWALPYSLLAQLLPANAEGQPIPDKSALLEGVLARLAEWPDRHLFLRSLREGLGLQAAWLHLAGDEQDAQRAVYLAATLEGMPVQQNPVVTHVIAASLRWDDE